jgi:hypothetical protein
MIWTKMGECYEQRFLGPQLTGRLLSFYLLPTRDINRILEMTRNGRAGAIASFVQRQDYGIPKCARKLLKTQEGP